MKKDREAPQLKRSPSVLAEGLPDPFGTRLSLPAKGLGPIVAVWCASRCPIRTRRLLHDTVVKSLGDLVALTTGGFQPFPVEDPDQTPPISDKAGRLQRPGDDLDGLAAHAQHLGQELLRERELALAYTVLRRE